MYTGRTDQPCCLCDDPKTVTRIAVPPRAVTLMQNAAPIAWRDIVGDVTLQFCESDWELVSALVLDLDTHPLSRCNVARADFSIREDFEALLNSTRDEPDQTEQEQQLLAEAHEVVGNADNPMVEQRDLVEAHVVIRAMAELGVDQHA
ncbi:hypothetical protein E6P09_10430 [Haloferax mediterranei ATCC 33500]|uniref:DUF7960 domain-containing protein n=1 Tax=Haloferax mediterranei (strain ATCC 33500 / DSM 1411 / JCM 8866 / NBRC 14739 / NCIMB 2177 / R-4) TaxID=523841 RepID=I3R4M9_HALMT|nr:hypothetical protein [Haloferax mediterranei]AFK19189.1 hypothetical protein HFX_1481 [Haloferax mediterranei ATCC 33500]AHZ21449.1 hypothetical protein BM92_01745 [Haloferax mediterranei ATCC 33500]EMA03908.1 hypothetical protein C439_03083 [Haloferax mediterranei ATCC 33500]MDX5989288.1 hypothetical protein [Haloferax mediterranei ATCC 33500]QCQ75659.1 hypothetical protein E6P09_10430 [Haloferax mediterranei ATCC 33500]